MSASIGQIAICCADVPRAKVFYVQGVGCAPLFDAGTLSFLRAGDLRLMLDVPEQDELKPPGSILYFRSSDIDADTARVAAAGGTIESPPHLVARMPDHELWMSFFRDTEGNLVAWMAQKPLA
jgi:methylmalonyl-CoA/ethylmalonyl-CoA epimerase